MATYNWSSLFNGDIITFDPSADVLHFDDAGINAAQISGYFYTDPFFFYSGFVITDGFQSVLLLFITDQRVFTDTNITFANGSRLLNGDNTVGTANDEGPNTLVGGTGNDQLAGYGGADSLVGGAGHDLLNGGAGNDTLIGGIGNDVFADDSGANRIEGGDGADFFAVVDLALVGPSTIVGGAGRDEYLPIFVTDGFNIAPTAVVTDFQTGTGGDLINLGALLSDIVYSGFYFFQDLFDPASGFLTLVQSGSDVLLGYDPDSRLSFGWDYQLVLTLSNVTVGNVTNDNIFQFAPGSNDPDNLTGSDARDFLYGADGDDTLDGGSGIDTLQGGTGNDLYFVDDPKDVIEEPAGGPSPFVLVPPSGSGEAAQLDEIGDTVSAAVSYSIQNIQNVESITLQSTATGGAGISATGNDLANVINGNELDNELDGLAGNDTIDAAAGHDTLRGGAGNDSLAGGAGNDVYLVDAAADIVYELAAAGTDLVQSLVTLTLAANVENLTLTGSAAINGTGNTLANVITGNGSANTLNGGNGNDSLVGGAGNDLFDWNGALRGGVDTMRGGAGDDQFNLSAGDVVIEFSGDGTDTAWVDLAGTYLLPANVENLTLWGSAAGVNARGNTLANVIQGNSAVNTLDGGDGNDTMNGGAGNDLFDWTASLRGGNDWMIGRQGDDQYSITAGDVVQEYVGEGTDTVWVDFAGAYVLPANLENLTLWGNAVGVNGTGNSAVNVILGNSQANTLNGAGGNDTMNGGAGNDLFDWTASLRGGNDWMYGRQGDDQFVINAGDVVQEFFTEGTDTVWVDFAGTYILGPTLENLTLWGSATGVNGTGNAGGNVITGNAQANTLNGSGGNDTLIGGAGNDLFDWTSSLRAGTDSMVGGTGDDQFNLSSGDIVVESAGQGTDTAWADFNGYTLPANVENLTLWGASAISGTGNSVNNTLTGNSAANTLEGGGGNDSLKGAGGADVFLFDEAPSPDTILDFTTDVDHIHLDNAIFTAFVATGPVSALNVQVATQASINATSGNAADGQDYLKYGSDTGNLYYDADGTGAGAIQLIATVYSGGTTPAVLAFDPTQDVVII